MLARRLRGLRCLSEQWLYAIDAAHAKDGKGRKERQFETEFLEKELRKAKKLLGEKTPRPPTPEISMDD